MIECGVTVLDTSLNYFQAQLHSLWLATPSFCLRHASIFLRAFAALSSSPCFGIKTQTNSMNMGHQLLLRLCFEGSFGNTWLLRVPECHKHSLRTSIKACLKKRVWPEKEHKPRRPTAIPREPLRTLFGGKDPKLSAVGEYHSSNLRPLQGQASRGKGFSECWLLKPFLRTLALKRSRYLESRGRVLHQFASNLHLLLTPSSIFAIDLSALFRTNPMESSMIV